MNARTASTLEDLPLLEATPRAWASLAAARLPEFLADHAVCEQQAALFALNLVAFYPSDTELVERMSSLAAEEVVHLRRVAKLLHERGLTLSPRRQNTYIAALHSHLRKDHPAHLKLDRLCVGALIEARSCERFTLLHEELTGRDQDREVTALLTDLGPAERRHWELFHALAAREADPHELEARWRGWLDIERACMSGRGVEPTVHG